MRSSRREPVACGVDVGSTNVKVVIIDPDGTVHGRAGRPTPRDEQGLSIDGSVLFDLVEALIGEVCTDEYEVHALCTVGVGEDGLLMDSQLRPLTPALAWFDPRRRTILGELRALLDDEPFDVASDAGRTMVGWAWARQQPAAKAAQTWVAVADLPAVLWTGHSFLSDTLASRTGAWRASSRAWADNRVTASLGAGELLPAVLPAGDIVGPVQSSALLPTGVIADEAIVVVGGHDHPVGGWGVDQMVPGAVLDSMGTAEVVVTQSSLPPPEEGSRVDIAPGIRSAGTTLLRVVELARNVAWATRDPAVESWIRALLNGAARPAAVLEAGYFQPGHRGGTQPAYRSDAPREPRARASAVLGALACAGRDSVAAVGGSPVDPSVVRLAGGWARSPGWVEIKEIVNGYRAMPIREPEVTAVGAALLAATARGWIPDPTTALGGVPAADACGLSPSFRISENKPFRSRRY